MTSNAPETEEPDGTENATDAVVIATVTTDNVATDDVTTDDVTTDDATADDDVIPEAVVIATVESDLLETEPVEPVPVGPEPHSSSGGAGGFLKRLFLAFIKVVFALLVIAALAFGAWLIFREIDRSFDNVIVRIDRNTRRIEEAEAEIDVLEEQNYARGVQVTELKAAVAEREEEIAALEEELGASLDQQGQALAEVGTEAEVLAGRADDLVAETALLGAGLVALQEDLNANGQQIDQLGGTVDGLEETLTALDGRSTELQSQVDDLAAEELAGWRRTVALFRAWETIGRARLRLLENNLGLASIDIELAIAALDDLIEGDADQAAEDLVTIRERLVLAAASLPDQPLVAGRDLETAWEALDAVVAEAVGIAE